MRHRLLVTVFVVLVTSACATMQGERPPALLAMQEFADQTSKVYGPRPGPTLFTGTAESVANRPPLVRLVLLTHSGGHLLVHRQMVDSPYLVPAVAQALAIRANGGEREQRGGFDASPTFPLLVLQAANAKAVDILIRVRGLSETEAMRVMHGYIAATGDQVCPQIVDLFRRYPAHVALGAGPGCSR